MSVARRIRGSRRPLRRGPHHATSATEPLVIHILVPLSTQSSPSRVRGCACRRVGAEVGLGQPEAADRLPAAIRGSHSSFCSSQPCFQIANIASEPCTDTRRAARSRRPRAPCRPARTPSRSCRRSRSPRGACRARRARRAPSPARGPASAALVPVRDVAAGSARRRTGGPCRGSRGPPRRSASRCRRGRAGAGCHGASLPPRGTPSTSRPVRRLRPGPWPSGRRTRPG